MFAVIGTCTSSQGTLTAKASGFTIGSTYTTRAWTPDGAPYPLPAAAASVAGDGGVGWRWPCQGDPAGDYTTQLTDDATGCTTDRVPFTVGQAAGRTGDPPPTTGPTPSPKPPPAATFTEISDNRNGTPVFADTQGGPVPASTPAKITFGTSVQVRCKVPNTTSISSVTFWYLLATAPWVGDYAPSDTFANGDPVGQPGTHNVDALVPNC